MVIRWAIILILALLVSVGLAAGTAAGVQALLPLMTVEWIPLRWLRIVNFAVIALVWPIVIFSVNRRWRAKKVGRGNSENHATFRAACHSSASRAISSTEAQLIGAVR